MIRQFPWSRTSAGTAPGRTRDDEITLYKSVGIGLEDIAVAGLAYSRIAGA